MGSAFTEKEKDIIKSALKEAAKHYASTIGMKKTTVDQLAESAGISKGAFYKFYESKEHLFFAILQDYHDEFYSAAIVIWNSYKNLSNSQRLAEVVLEICSLIEKHSLMDFLENELPYVLRKIPAEELEKHHADDYIQIKKFIDNSGLQLKEPFEILLATLDGITLSLMHRKEIGELYPRVLRIIVQGACDQLVY